MRDSPFQNKFMDVLTVIFAGSFAGIAAMIAVKLYHIKVNRNLFFHDSCHRLDALMKEKYREVKQKSVEFLKRFTHSAKNYLREILVKILGEIKLFVEKYYAKAHDYIKGRKVLKNSGSSSFFLRDISEYKSKLTTRR